MTSIISRASIKVLFHQTLEASEKMSSVKPCVVMTQHTLDVLRDQYAEVLEGPVSQQQAAKGYVGHIGNVRLFVALSKSDVDDPYFPVETVRVLDYEFVTCVGTDFLLE